MEEGPIQEPDNHEPKMPELIPASMLAAFAYCPRLCYIEWVQGEQRDSAEIVEGKSWHRWVDSEQDAIPEGFQPFHARSVFLAAPEAGVCCRIDLLEGDSNRITPVEYKRGEAPSIPEGAYESDLAQLCAQCLALRENGFQCDEGMVYFIRSKTKVPVNFDDVLVNRTRDLIAALRRIAGNGEIPPPLEDSPKCYRCSLAGVCLPDEVNLLKEMNGEGKTKGDLDRGELEDKTKGELEEKVRMLLPARDDQLPVYVVGQGQTVRKRGDRLEIWSKEGKISEAKLRDVSQVCLYGGVEITTPAMVELMQRGVPVLHFTHGGWFEGIALGHTHKNVELRLKQFEWARDSSRSLVLARNMIAGKIRNCRTLLRRNDPQVPPEVLESLARLSRDTEAANSLETLLGIEGAAAGAYFRHFSSMLKSKASEFSFQDRNKRPPRDPVNAVLSYLYGILAKELFVILLAAGFDPYLGFYHQPKYGRPALALDMMEEFRPLIADSTAITLFNKGEFSGKDFIRTGLGVSMSPVAKKKVVAGYERRMQMEITHPLFSYTVSYRRIMEVQVRLLSRVLSGELNEYPAFVTR